MRSYKMLIDGQTVGMIKPGTTWSGEIAPGDHSIQLKLDFASSVEIKFSVKAGESAGFQCKPRTFKFGTYLVGGLMTINDYMILTRDEI